MAEEEEGPDPPETPGMPAWVMTFADLMSLLMCFFVLLLSFSQMDLSKFKKVAGSMEKAFGVQRDIVAYEIPKGTSVIAKEFSPGKPEPTPFNEIRQKTVEDLRQTLEYDKIRTDGRDANQSSGSNMNKFDAREDNAVQKYKDIKDISKESKDGKKMGAEEAAEQFAKALAQEIMEGTVEIEAYGQRVIVRILEEGSFESGSAILKKRFMPILKKIEIILKMTPGEISISGHTDDLPIYTERFRSNWELSAARAVSVVHELLKDKEINPSRMAISGHGQTRPIFANNSRENRRHNRRIEISLVQGDKPYFKPIEEPVQAKTKAATLKKPPLKVDPLLQDVSSIPNSIKTDTKLPDAISPVQIDGPAGMGSALEPGSKSEPPKPVIPQGMFWAE